MLQNFNFNLGIYLSLSQSSTFTMAKKDSIKEECKRCNEEAKGFIRRYIIQLFSCFPVAVLSSAAGYYQQDVMC
jgi:hypothetical protein